MRDPKDDPKGEDGRGPALAAAVVGSGFGGLAAAIRLQAAGYAVTLFEARDKPGGRAYVYTDQGFTFDAGPTVITAPGCLEELGPRALDDRRCAKCGATATLYLREPGASLTTDVPPLDTAEIVTSSALKSVFLR